jgi:hypothetical protein
MSDLQAFLPAVGRQQFVKKAYKLLPAKIAIFWRPTEAAGLWPENRLANLPSNGRL